MRELTVLHLNGNVGWPPPKVGVGKNQMQSCILKTAQQAGPSVWSNQWGPWPSVEICYLRQIKILISSRLNQKRFQIFLNSSEVKSLAPALGIPPLPSASPRGSYTVLRACQNPALSPPTGYSQLYFWKYKHLLQWGTFQLVSTCAAPVKSIRLLRFSSAVLPPTLLSPLSGTDLHNDCL